MTQSIIDIIHAYAKRHPAEADTLNRSMDLLSQGSGDITERATTPAHITSSVLIRQGEASLLLIWHPYLKMWVQPGGHVDPGEDLPTAAVREALEETGISCTLDNDMPYDIDCLFVPANPKKGEGDHWHIDFRYLMTPVKGAPVSDPELLTAYVAFSDLGTLSPSLTRLGDKLMNIPQPLAVA